MTRLIDLQKTDKDLMDLRQLARMVIVHMFDDNCPSSYLHTINQQFEKWIIHLNAVDQLRKATWGISLSDSMPLGKKGTWEDEMRFQLGIMAEWMVKNEKGEYEDKKKLWSDHKVDFRHTAEFGFLFPEVYRASDFENGMKALKDHMKTNPEDY